MKRWFLRVSLCAAALAIGVVFDFFWIIDWQTYLWDWLFPKTCPFVLGGVEY